MAADWHPLTWDLARRCAVVNVHFIFIPGHRILELEAILFMAKAWPQLASNHIFLRSSLRSDFQTAFYVATLKSLAKHAIVGSTAFFDALTPRWATKTATIVLFQVCHALARCITTYFWKRARQKDLASELQTGEISQGLIETRIMATYL